MLNYKECMGIYISCFFCYNRNTKKKRAYALNKKETTP